MVLLSQLIRTAAVTGRSDNLAEWFAERQGGRWAEQMVRAAVPAAAADESGAPVTLRAADVWTLDAGQVVELMG